MKLPRTLAACCRISVRGLLLLTLIVGITLLWWKDRGELLARIQRLEERISPTPISSQSWSPQQATGPPNTPKAGDFPTAWASATQDGQPEWLELTFAKRIRPKALDIHASHNPGAVVKVTAVEPSGNEIVIWQGTDPTPTTAAMGISTIHWNRRIATNRVKIYLASDKVPGWNEIDAVGLRTRWGRVYWAEQATASSTYGVPPTGYRGFAVQTPD